MAQLTALEWLVEHWKKLQSKGEKMTWKQIIDITELVKEMEKEQIENAFNYGNHNKWGSESQINNGKDYYNETYKNQSHDNI